MSDSTQFGLTDKQLSVVEFSWMDVEDIAEELNMGTRNVRYHLDQARNKLGLSTKRELALWARERGLLRLN